MKTKVYTKRKYDVLAAGRSTTAIVETAASLYAQLEAACDENASLHKRYDILRRVFATAVEQSVRECKIEFVGLFAKLDYCVKEQRIPYPAATLLQMARKELFPRPNQSQETSDDHRIRNFGHNLKAAALLVFYLCGREEIPAALEARFPAEDRQSGWGKFDEKVVRAVVERWDDNHIWATEEENGTTIQICYGEGNRYLTREGEGSWSYLKQILWEGAQLNLVRIRKSDESDIYLPELIILEPDYLINITTIAACFETYAESPFVNLVKKISPQPNSMAIHLGNLAGQFLDDTVHGRNISYEESLGTFINRNALSLITCDDIAEKYGQFVQEGKVQKRNIQKLIGEDLPSAIGSYDPKKVVLEPSFFSEILGIQGRFDFLYRSGSDINIIEQKSGKGEFVRRNDPGYDPERPKEKEQHEVQALLYRAIYQYGIGESGADDIDVMLLYSKYAKGLIKIKAMPQLFLRAIRMRNLLAWSEYLYAKEGLEILADLTPEKLNMKHASGTLWEMYVRPRLDELLAPIHNATPTERNYYLRFLRFLENEQLLAKVGNKQKENSGFASIWHDTLEEKKSAGSIYDNLTLSAFIPAQDDASSIEGILLKFNDKEISSTANFRIGDIVILHPYRQGSEPDACADMVWRSSIVDITEEAIELRLRNSQADKKVFPQGEGWRWAVEHDMFESMTGSLYSAMHSFLSATKARRDLLLAQRPPAVEESRTLKGDYGAFNTLSLRAKQAKELFLIIGPPGTGKTSYGLTNILKEELLEADTNVLLLSYTNRAVDEICSKLAEIEEEQPRFDFIRIGSDLSCSPEYRSHLLGARSAACQTCQEVGQLIGRCRVFCGTTAALNANIALLKIKHFSLAIVDESSQILEPHLIGLLSAHNDGVDAIDKFVLIGDHKQLPAVVQQPSEESVVSEPDLRAIGLTDCRLSLFERLLKQFKTAEGYDERFVYTLTKQGRMHREIAAFPNLAFYNSRLEVVPLGHQELPNRRVAGNGIVEMLTTRRIAFVASEAPHDSPSDKTNAVEAEMIAATVKQIYQLEKERFDKDRTVGVIVPYRNQIAAVRNAIDKQGIPLLHGITIDTVERYQGSQRDYIIYGFTIQQHYQLNFLSGNTFEEDEAVIDRKLNVAMTRARLNLILIGNPRLLADNHTFAQLMEYARSRDSYFDMPAEDYCRGTFSVAEG